MINIEGRLLGVCIGGGSNFCGYRMVKCESVCIDAGKVQSMVVRTYDPYMKDFLGPRIKLRSKAEWTGVCRGVYKAGKLRPIEGVQKLTRRVKYRSARELRSATERGTG